MRHPRRVALSIAQKFLSEFATLDQEIDNNHKYHHVHIPEVKPTLSGFSLEDDQLGIDVKDDGKQIVFKLKGLKQVKRSSRGASNENPLENLFSIVHENDLQLNSELIAQISKLKIGFTAQSGKDIDYFFEHMISAVTSALPGIQIERMAQIGHTTTETTDLGWILKFTLNMKKLFKLADSQEVAPAIPDDTITMGTLISNVEKQLKKARTSPTQPKPHQPVNHNDSYIDGKF